MKSETLKELTDYLRENLSVSLVKNDDEIVVIIKLNGEAISSDYVYIDG
jgi:hypothetical protein